MQNIRGRIPALIAVVAGAMMVSAAIGQEAPLEPPPTVKLNPCPASVSAGSTPSVGGTVNPLPGAQSYALTIVISYDGPADDKGNPVPLPGVFRRFVSPPFPAGSPIPPPDPKRPYPPVPANAVRCHTLVTLICYSGPVIPGVPATPTDPAQPPKPSGDPVGSGAAEWANVPVTKVEPGKKDPNPGRGNK